MALSPINQTNSHRAKEITKLLDHLPSLKHGKLLERAVGVLLRIASDEVDIQDLKILTYTLEDLEKGFRTFYPYRHVRKITIFGSARISPNASEYLLAVKFARRVADLGFMVLTGAGGGIMQAGNEGAGPEHSFGLNIQLPFEQESNPFIADDPKLIDFKYFFTRKLFFLRESDAIALFPGGFGTQDEAFETLTLCQTGKYGPAPLVLIDEPGGDYWQSWNEYISSQLLARGLISPEDPCLYTITDDLEVACAAIRNFYRVYHSCHYINGKFVMRLNVELTEDFVEELNQDFSDILVKGRIKKSKALPEEIGEETENLPRLIFDFNQRDFGKLYQMINRLNQLEIPSPDVEHPELK